MFLLTCKPGSAAVLPQFKKTSFFKCRESRYNLFLNFIGGVKLFNQISILHINSLK